MTVAELAKADIVKRLTHIVVQTNGMNPIVVGVTVAVQAVRQTPSVMDPQTLHVKRDTSITATTNGTDVDHHVVHQINIGVAAIIMKNNVTIVRKMQLAMEHPT